MIIELAMVKSCKYSMVGIIHSLCHRHLRDNTKRQMKHPNSDKAIEVLDIIFDSRNAMVTCNKEDEFNEKAATVDTEAFKTPSYFDDLKEKIWNSVIIPRQKAGGAIKLKNTTNNVGK